MESNRVDALVGSSDREDAGDGMVRGISFKCHGEIWEPMAEDGCSGECLLQLMEGGCFFVAKVPRHSFSA